MLKNLVPVKFTFDTSSSKDATRKEEGRDAICPSCKKGFSNSIIQFCECAIDVRRRRRAEELRVVAKPCSHVTCKTCTDTLVKPAKQCIVCDRKLGDKDIIELKREGMCHFGLSLCRILNILQGLVLREEVWPRRRRKA